MSSLCINTDIGTSSITSIKQSVRCECCNKKLGLVHFSCKCGGVYCAIHRADSVHNCTYDYKVEHKKTLSTSMVKLESVKVEIL